RERDRQPAHHVCLRRRGCRRRRLGGLPLMKSLRNPQRRPTHPGAILREDVLPALRMTQTELAERLGVSRLSVSELLHEKRALSPEMAARVAKLLRTSPA